MPSDSDYKSFFLHQLTLDTVNEKEYFSGLLKAVSEKYGADLVFLETVLSEPFFYSSVFSLSQFFFIRDILKKEDLLKYVNSPDVLKKRFSAYSKEYTVVMSESLAEIPDYLHLVCCIPKGDIDTDSELWKDFLDLFRLGYRIKVRNSVKVPKTGYSASRPDSMKKIITRNKKMISLIEEAEKMSATSSPVLILGESGTGKELFADLIHSLSPRKNNPLTAINCAALPENLLETELMGYVKGSFTGAEEDRKGKLELAHKSTVFLDEIGELPYNLQAKLLRFLETGSIVPVGSNKPVQVDVRIISATNMDIRSRIKSNDFRHDLYYRLGVFECRLPPLRERLEDIPVLADFFAEKISLGSKKISLEAINELMLYKWPGNIRELENIIQRAVVMSDGSEILISDLQLPGDINTGNVYLNKKYKDALNLFKKRLIESTLEIYNGNRTLSARALGLQRTYLARLITELGIKR